MSNKTQLKKILKRLNRPESSSMYQEHGLVMKEFIVADLPARLFLGVEIALEDGGFLPVVLANIFAQNAHSEWAFKLKNLIPEESTSLFALRELALLNILSNRGMGKADPPAEYIGEVIQRTSYLLRVGDYTQARSYIRSAERVYAADWLGRKAGDYPLSLEVKLKLLAVEVYRTCGQYRAARKSCRTAIRILSDNGGRLADMPEQERLEIQTRVLIEVEALGLEWDQSEIDSVQVAVFKLDTTDSNSRVGRLSAKLMFLHAKRHLQELNLKEAYECSETGLCRLLDLGELEKDVYRYEIIEAFLLFERICSFSGDHLAFVRVCQRNSRIYDSLANSQKGRVTRLEVKAKLAFHLAELGRLDEARGQLSDRDFLVPEFFDLAADRVDSSILVCSYSAKTNVIFGDSLGALHWIMVGRSILKRFPRSLVRNLDAARLELTCASAVVFSDIGSFERANGFSRLAIWQLIKIWLKERFGQIVLPVSVTDLTTAEVYCDVLVGAREVPRGMAVQTVEKVIFDVHSRLLDAEAIFAVRIVRTIRRFIWQRSRLRKYEHAHVFIKTLLPFFKSLKAENRFEYSLTMQEIQWCLAEECAALNSLPEMAMRLKKSIKAVAECEAELSYGPRRLLMHAYQRLANSYRMLGDQSQADSAEGAAEKIYETLPEILKRREFSTAESKKLLVSIVGILKAFILFKADSIRPGIWKDTCIRFRFPDRNCLLMLKLLDKCVRSGTVSGTEERWVMRKAFDYSCSSFLLANATAVLELRCGRVRTACRWLSALRAVDSRVKFDRGLSDVIRSNHDLCFALCNQPIREVTFNTLDVYPNVRECAARIAKMVSFSRWKGAYRVCEKSAPDFAQLGKLGVRV